MWVALGKVPRQYPRTTVLAVVLLFVGALGGGVYAYYARALRHWRAAEQALAEGRPADACENLKVCLDVWPRSVSVHLLAARADRLTGNVRAAEAHLNHCLALQKGPKDDIQLEFYLLRVQMGEEDEVAPALLSCVDNKHPQSAMILEHLTLAYLHNLRYGPALNCLDRWMREAPDAARPLYLRGRVRERMSNSSGALEDYRQALARDPALFPARLRLVEVLLEKADVGEALAHLEHLREQAPGRPEVTARLGQARLLQGRREEARPLLEAAVRQLPRDLPLLVDLAKLEIQEGHPARAEAWLRQALEVDPTDTEARYQLVASLQGQGRHEEAAAMLAQYEQDNARMKRATKLLQEEVRHPSNNPDALYELATLLLRSKQEGLGLYWLYQALECNPEHPPTNRALAEYYEKKGHLRKAASFRRRLTTSSTTSTGRTSGESSSPTPK